MKDLHIVLDELDIKCGNCDAKLSPDDADHRRSKIFRAGFYSCPNCFINITISEQTAEWATIGILGNCLERMQERQW